MLKCNLWIIAAEAPLQPGLLSTSARISKHALAVWRRIISCQFELSNRFFTTHADSGGSCIRCFCIADAGLLSFASRCNDLSLDWVRTPTALSRCSEHDINSYLAHIGDGEKGRLIGFARLVANHCRPSSCPLHQESVHRHSQQWQGICPALASGPRLSRISLHLLYALLSTQPPTLNTWNSWSLPAKQVRPPSRHLSFVVRELVVGHLLAELQHNANLVSACNCHEACMTNTQRKSLQSWRLG